MSDKEKMEFNIASKKEADELNFKREAKFAALRAASEATRKDGGDITSISETIYNWLTKDL